jgi:hypothetical protein
MCFRSIGTLASAVLAEANEKRAAAATNSAAGIGDGPVAQEEGNATEPPTRLDAQGGSASNVMKRTGAETPASDARGVVRQTTADAGGKRTVASLPVGRDMVVARSAEPQGARRQPAPPVSATIIPMSIYRARRHDLTVPR